MELAWKYLVAREEITIIWKGCSAIFHNNFWGLRKFLHFWWYDTNFTLGTNLILVWFYSKPDDFVSVFFCKEKKIIKFERLEHGENCFIDFVKKYNYASYYKTLKFIRYNISITSLGGDAKNFKIILAKIQSPKNLLNIMDGAHVWPKAAIQLLP